MITLRWMVIASAFAVSSCASIVDGTLESAEHITFVSMPTGADIKANGQVICRTPCQRRIPSNKIRSLYAELDGYPSIALAPKGKANVNVAGNLLFGGILGLGVDVLSGRVTQYQDTISIDFTDTTGD